MTICIAFRGHSIKAPPNTASAIKKALRVGVDGIYLDLNCTKDEVIVCNAEFEHSLIPGGILTSKINYSELQNINIGDKYGSAYSEEKILRIEEAFDLIGEKTNIYLGLISGSRHHPSIEERILDFLTEREVLEKTTIVSLDHMALRWLKKMEFKLSTLAMVYARLAKPVEFARDIDADGMVCFQYQLTRFIVEAAHEAAMKIFTFPVNNKQDALEMQEINVDGIFSSDAVMLQECNK